MFRFSERDALRRALTEGLLPAVILDLDHADETCLDVIGLVQRAAPVSRLICATARKAVEPIANRSSATFSYVRLPAEPVQLRKQLSRAPVAETLRFQGPCGGRSLLDVLMLLLFSGLSGRLIVWNTWMRGELWVHRGQVVHAELGGQQGLKAAQAILKWPRGTFRFQKGRPSVHTLQLTPYNLLLQSTDAAEPAELVDSGDAAELADARDGADDLAAELAPGSSASGGSAPAPAPGLESNSSRPELAPSSLSSSVSPPVALGLASYDSRPDLAPSSLSSSVSPPVALGLQTFGSRVSTDSSWSLPMPLPAAVQSSLFSETRFEPAPETEAARLIESVAQADAALPGEEPAATNSIEQLWQQIDQTFFTPTQVQEETMAVTATSVKDVLSRLELTVEGFIGAAVADSDSGMCLGATGGAGIMNVEVAAASNTEVVRSKRKAIKTLNLRDEIEDILITLGKQYHLIRPLRSRPGVFIYLAVDRSRANLAMARFALADAERDLGA